MFGGFFFILFTITVMSAVLVKDKRMWNKFKPQVDNSLLTDQQLQNGIKMLSKEVCIFQHQF